MNSVVALPRFARAPQPPVPDRLLDALAIGERPEGIGWLRRVAHITATLLPDPAVRALTAGAKRLRARTAAAPDHAPIARLPESDGLLPGARLCVLLTHDLDRQACWDALSGVLQEEHRRGLASVVHVLTGGPYVYSSAVADLIHGYGCTLGLHGHTHDYALGWKSDDAIRRHLDRSLKILGAMPRWYRAPAFCVSVRLCRWLVHYGIEFDSSRTVFHPRYRSTRSLIPYVAAEGLWECPVGFEDSSLLRDLALEPPQAVRECGRLLQLAQSAGGLLVIDTHPSLLAEAGSFYPRLLDLLQSAPGVRMVSSRQVEDLLRSACAR